MSKTMCTWVELDRQGVNQLLQDTSNVVKETANQVASTAGQGAKVEMGTRAKRPIAFVDMPYKEASKDNKLIKSVFGRKND